MKTFIFTFIIFQLGWWSSNLYEYIRQKREEQE